MPGEIFVIVIVAILAGTFSSVAKMVIGYLRERNGAAAAGNNSLTTSELKQIVASSVAEATAPLEDRFEKLERRLEYRLPPAGTHLADEPERDTDRLPH